MPIYEYYCESCLHEFEVLVLNRNEVVQCSSCSSRKLTKVISAHAVGNGLPDTACGAAPCSPEPACGAGGCPSRQ